MAFVFETSLSLSARKFWARDRQITTGRTPLPGEGGRRNKFARPLTRQPD